MHVIRNDNRKCNLIKGFLLILIEGISKPRRGRLFIYFLFTLRAVMCADFKAYRGFVNKSIRNYFHLYTYLLLRIKNTIT